MQEGFDEPHFLSFMAWFCAVTDWAKEDGRIRVFDDGSERLQIRIDVTKPVPLDEIELHLVIPPKKDSDDPA